MRSKYTHEDVIIKVRENLENNKTCPPSKCKCADSGNFHRYVIE